MEINNKYAKSRISAFRKGKIKIIRNPEKYKEFLTDEEYNELIGGAITLQACLDFVNKKYENKASTLLKHQSSIRGIFTLLKLNTFEDFFKYENEYINESINNKYAQSNKKSIYSALNLIFDEYSYLKLKYPSHYENVIINRKKVFYKDYNETQAELKEKYDRMININHKDPELKLIHFLYTKFIYDENGELIFIPGNCFHNILLLPVDNNNSYNYETGRVNIGTYTYIISPENREFILSSIGERPRSHILSNRYGNCSMNAKLLNNKIKDALGMGLNEYRRIMNGY